MSALPAPRPCGSCPYRRDVPSGVWAAEEYAKLPGFDGETGYQTPAVFFCHQQDGRLCAGWAGCHDMAESLGLRLAMAMGMVTPEEGEALLDYTTDMPLFATGKEAAEHGLRELERVGPKAAKVIGRLQKRGKMSGSEGIVMAPEDTPGGRPE